MERSAARQCGVVMAGFGSPHGDDAAGWRVAALLRKRPRLPARILTVTDVAQFVEALDDCSKLIVVDACESGRRPGTLSRLCWPDQRIAEHHGNSTHALGVWHALRLAEALGRLPGDVTVYGIEVEHCEPGRALSAEVARAVDELAAIIAAELHEMVLECVP